MTRPHFESNAFTDARTDPGATGHIAGRSPEARIAAIEQAIKAVTRYALPPEGTADGSVATADDAQAGRVKWQPGFRVISERASRGNPGGTANVHLNPDGTLDIVGDAGSTAGHVYIDPADWGASGVKIKVRGWVQTETDPTDSTVTVGVARLNTPGATGSIASASALGSPTTASIAGVNAANTVYSAVSAEITVTTAGLFRVTFSHSVAPAQVMTYGYTLLGRAAGA